MKLSRRDTTDLGPPRQSAVPVVPERFRLPLLILVLAICAAVFIAAVAYGLGR